MTEPRPTFPTVIKHYQLVRTIGQGGMGLVCEGVDRRDGTRVAVKLLFPALAASDPSFIDRFEREAHVAALLRSPYTVHLIDFGVEENATYLVMEFIDGETLAALVRRDPPTPQRALRIAGEIARALEEASARGVVHRDIKPENVLLDKAGRVKVTDFGIARAAQGASLTQTGLFLGTPTYAAPEQIDGQVDHRSDIYSLGVTLYAMLAGHPPFIGKTPIDTMLSHRSSPLPMAPLSHVPDAVTNIVRRCMEKDPLDRYQTASELAGAIDRARASLVREEAAASGTPQIGGFGSSGSQSSYQPPPQVAPQPAAEPSSAAQPQPAAQPSYQPVPAVAPPQPPPAAPVPAYRVSEPLASAPGSDTYVVAPPAAPRVPAQETAQSAAVPMQLPGQVAPAAKGRLLLIIGGSVLAAAVVAGGAFVALSGDDDPGASPTTATAMPSPTSASATAAASPPTSTSTTAATVAPTNLPSVTAPAAVSRLRSGATARVLVAINLTEEPTLAGATRVIRALVPGERVIVVTNTPERSTLVITEGVIFWRVVIEGTQIVGWVPEVTSTGATRYLDTVQ